MDNFDELLELDDVDGFHSSKERKSGKKGLILTVAAVVTCLGAGLGYAVHSGMVTLPKDSPPPVVETTQDEAAEKPVVQLVNIEQLTWANMMCVEMAQYPQKLKSMPVYDKQASPIVVKKDMAEVLKENALVIRNEAKRINSAVAWAHDKALKKQLNTLVTDNNRAVGDVVDPRTSAASHKMSSALNGYANSLSDMAKDLDAIATYDFGGMREAIAAAPGTMEELSRNLAANVSHVFEDDLFDNVVTMEAVALSTYCNGAFINIDELRQEFGDELDEQQKLKNMAVRARCEEFVDRTDRVSISNESLKKNRKACEEALISSDSAATASQYPNGVDYQDHLRAKPIIDTADMQAPPPSSVAPPPGSPDSPAPPVPPAPPTQ